VATMLLVIRIVLNVAQDLAVSATWPGYRSRPLKEARFQNWLWTLALAIVAFCLLAHFIILNTLPETAELTWIVAALPALVAAVAYGTVLAGLSLRLVVFPCRWLGYNPSLWERVGSVCVAVLHGTLYVVAACLTVFAAPMLAGAEASKWSLTAWLLPFVIFSAGCFVYHSRGAVMAIRHIDTPPVALPENTERVVAWEQYVSDRPETGAQAGQTGEDEPATAPPPDTLVAIPSLISDDEDDDDDTSVSGEGALCVLCCSRPACVALIPCGHVGSCVKCSKKLCRETGSCPFCRVPITYVLHLFFVGNDLSTPLDGKNRAGSGKGFDRRRNTQRSFRKDAYRTGSNPSMLSNSGPSLLARALSFPLPGRVPDPESAMGTTAAPDATTGAVSELGASVGSPGTHVFQGPRRRVDRRGVVANVSIQVPIDARFENALGSPLMAESLAGDDSPSEAPQTPTSPYSDPNAAGALHHSVSFTNRARIPPPSSPSIRHPPSGRSPPGTPHLPPTERIVPWRAGPSNTSLVSLAESEVSAPPSFRDNAPPPAPVAAVRFPGRTL